MRQGKIRHAYVLDFAESGFSEFENAKFVAKKLGIELRRAVLSSEEPPDFFSVVDHADDPLADSSALAVWALSREVARDYKVVISGDGGDELFGGYLTYKATQYHRMLMTGMPSAARTSLRWLGLRMPVSGGKVTPSYKLRRFLRAADLSAGEAHFTWNGGWLPAEAAALLADPATSELARSAIERLAGRHHLTRSPSLGDLQRADATDYLPNDILTKVDRMTMAHGLEARAPLLNPAVAEFALRLPDELKLSPFGKPKKILRDLATERFGTGIGNAKKQGFSIPIHNWLRRPARMLAEDLLSRKELDAVGCFNTDSVLRAKASHMEQRAQLGFELWGLMVLVAWHRARIRNSPRPKSGQTLRRIIIPSMAERLE